MRASQAGGEQLLVFDTTVLNHFALAERLDVLADLIIDQVCATTAVVLDELRTGAERKPELRTALELDWMQVIALDQPDEISASRPGSAESARASGTWVRRVSSPQPSYATGSR